MSNEDVVIYEPILSTEDKLQTFQRLPSSSQMLLRGTGEKSLKLRVDEVAADGTLRAHFEEASIPFRPGEKLTVWFEIGGDRFFFPTKARFQGSQVSMPLPAELYKKQRRQNFRLSIPANYPATFQVAGETVSAPLPILDINGDGLGLLAPFGTSFRVGEKLAGRVELGGRGPVEVHGTVRHVKASDKGVQIGLQFTARDGGDEDALHEMILLFRVDHFRGQS